LSRCSPAAGAGEEIDVKHGIVEIFAYQETLLAMAIFGMVILAMIWVGFRRWLQHKERIGGLIVEQVAERTARVEARLKAVEQVLTDGALQKAAEIDTLRTSQIPEPALKRDEV
jgi:hypothetical protein